MKRTTNCTRVSFCVGHDVGKRVEALVAIMHMHWLQIMLIYPHISPMVEKKKLGDICPESPFQYLWDNLNVLQF